MLRTTIGPVVIAVLRLPCGKRKASGDDVSPRCKSKTSRLLGTPVELSESESPSDRASDPSESELGRGVEADQGPAVVNREFSPEGYLSEGPVSFSEGSTRASLSL